MSKEIKLKRCLGHGVKLHVLQAEWKGLNVVLKSCKPLASKHAMWYVDGLIPPNTKKENFGFKMKDFIYHVSKSLIYVPQ